MKRVALALTLVLALVTSACKTWGPCGSSSSAPHPRVPPALTDIYSHVQTLPTGERILIERVLINAPVADVWAAYTTADGYAAWAAPIAEVDLRVGGTIRTNYAPGARIGDPGTNTLHIVNYVPNRLLTLRADLSTNWPEVMKEDADHLTNVIVFDPVDDRSTRIESYGIGYGAGSGFGPEYEKLLGFFAKANRGLYEKLKTHLER